MATDDLKLNEYLTPDNNINESKLVQAENVVGTFQKPDILGQSSYLHEVGAEGSFTTSSIPAGSAVNVRNTITFKRAQVNIPKIAFDIYVDNDNDDDYLVPSGSTMTVANIPEVDWHLARTSINVTPGLFEEGVYQFPIFIKNHDSVAHVYHIHVLYIYPLLGVNS